MPTADSPQFDKTLAAVCGLFCPSCAMYIGSTVDPARLERMAAERGMAVEDLQCRGCRSDKRIAYCATCFMYRCASDKGVDFCGACPDYPCQELRDFQAKMPHRLDLWQAQERIRAAGWETWFEEMLARYGCPECGAINSAYDAICYVCGHKPSCAYVAEHGKKVAAFLATR